MFGAKKVADEEWCSRIADAAAEVKAEAAKFGFAGQAVARDPISGWMQCAEILSSLDETKQRLSRLRSRIRAAGRPSDSPDLQQANRLFDSFFDTANLAVRWGKFHIKDASGGPGLRALTETGFAQRAATIRVANNGKQFAAAANKAARDGTLAADTVTAHTTAYRSEAPPLVDLFVTATGLQLPQRPGDVIIASQVAIVAAWCFREASILGMLLSEAPNTALPSVWDPNRSQAFADRVGKWSLDLLGDRTDPKIFGHRFLALQFPTIFAPVVEMGQPFDQTIRQQTRAANAKVLRLDAWEEWATVTALGYGLGAFHPEVVREALASEERGIDDHDWADARAAGLDIPREQPKLSLQDQVDNVVDLCRPYLREHYPEAFAVIRKYN